MTYAVPPKLCIGGGAIVGAAHVVSPRCDCQLASQSALHAPVMSRRGRGGGGVSAAVGHSAARFAKTIDRKPRICSPHNYAHLFAQLQLMGADDATSAVPDDSFVHLTVIIQLVPCTGHQTKNPILP